MNAADTALLFSHGFSVQRLPQTNEVLPNMTRNFTGFHISYAPHIAHYGGATTALVLQGRVFLILNGNHAADMVLAAERDGMQGCIGLFIERIQQANSYSDHRMASHTAADPFQLRPTMLEMIGQGNMDRITAAAAAQLPAQLPNVH